MLQTCLHVTYGFCGGIAFAFIVSFLLVVYLIRRAPEMTGWESEETQ